jgi:nucleoside-diphosphate-sugar epimerase
VAALKVLFIGGTGIISSACSRRVVATGADLTILNRGTTTTRAVPEGAEVVVADIRDPASVRTALGNRAFDVVADFIAFTPEHVQTDVDLFRDRVGQYVFISSASAYQTPPARLPIVESTPLRNPYWQYSRDKIACEELLVAAYRADGFPATIVRPSHTYDRTSVPLMGGWTDIERMRRGQPVVVQGDGTSLWTLTHHDDFAKAFVGLLGHPQAVGDSFQITSDEVLTWNQIYNIMADAAGVQATLVHVASDTIAAHDAELGASLLGDRTHSVIFDNTKVKSLVPDYVAAIPFVTGAREIVEWYDADPGRRTIDAGFDALFDKLVAAVS